jgi:tellurite resistance protein TerC
MSWSEQIRSLWNLENIKIVRRVIVSVIGGTVLLIGIALLVLPGPAFIVIPIGLAILATEFAWARHWLRKVRQVAGRVIPGRGREKSEPTNAGAIRNAGE